MRHERPDVDELREAHQAVDRWLDSLRSPNTRSAYRLDLSAYLRWCAAVGVAPLAPAPGDVDRFRTDPALPAGRAASARRGSALAAFLRFAQAPASTPSAPTPSAVGSAPGRATSASSTAVLDEGERRGLLGSLGDHGTATQVLVRLLLVEGLKLDEALGLDAQQVSVDAPPLRVALARRPPVELELEPATAAVIAGHLGGRRHGPLLVSASRREPAGTRLSRHGADYLLRRAGVRSGLTVPLTSNVLRRTHAEHAHASGRALDAIANRMGHDDVRTTRRYLDPTPTTGDVGSRRRPISQEV